MLMILDFGSASPGQGKDHQSSGFIHAAIRKQRGPRIANQGSVMDRLVAASPSAGRPAGLKCWYRTLRVAEGLKIGVSPPSFSLREQRRLWMQRLSMNCRSGASPAPPPNALKISYICHVQARGRSDCKAPSSAHWFLRAPPATATAQCMGGAARNTPHMSAVNNGLTRSP